MSTIGSNTTQIIMAAPVVEAAISNLRDVMAQIDGFEQAILAAVGKPGEPAFGLHISGRLRLADAIALRASVPTGKSLPAAANETFSAMVTRALAEFDNK